MKQAQRARLRNEIVAERGYWAPFHEVLLERGPEFLKAYLAFQAAPVRSGVLERKLCELIYVAIDVSVNHMYESGGRRHMELAMRSGAKLEEVLQTILITTVVAAHQPLDAGLVMLMEETGHEPTAPEGDARKRKDSHIAATGRWPEAGDFMLELAPNGNEGYFAYGEAAWQAGPLAPREKELIALAVCAAPTCLFEAGMRRHMRAALKAGASRAEVAAVLQLAAALSIHTCTIAIPALEEAVAAVSRSATEV
jgi:AhpD family alkylhydroperoxidase